MKKALIIITFTLCILSSISYALDAQLTKISLDDGVGVEVYVNPDVELDNRVFFYDEDLNHIGTAQLPCEDPCTEEISSHFRVPDTWGEGTYSALFLTVWILWHSVFGGI